MNIHYKQPQIELFPENSASLPDVNKPRFLLANLTLSAENLVILSILGIMVAVFAYSIGVERGKQMVAYALDERVTAAWNLQKQAPVQKPVTQLVITPTKGNRGIVTAPVKRTVSPAPAVQTKPKVVVNKANKSAVKTVPVSSHITVQVATYKVASFAQKEALNLRAQGYQSFIIKKGDYYLVCAGRYASLEQANIYLQKLQAKYRGSQIRRF